MCLNVVNGYTIHLLDETNGFVLRDLPRKGQGNMEEQISKEAIYSKRADVIAAIMASYSNQIEDYEKRNYGECMMCVSFCAAILAAIGAFLMGAPSKIVSAEEAKLVIAFVIMLIPVTITIFLYNFAMNCRRSAVLRGYMQFLEEDLNKILHETSMVYHGALFSDEIALFPVNVFGPLALGVALVALFATCALWSYGLYEQSQLVEERYIVFYWLVLCTCIICCSIFAVALMRNNQAVKRSKETCEKQYIDYTMQVSTADTGSNRDSRWRVSFWRRIRICLHNVLFKKIRLMKSKFMYIWSKW